MEWGLWSLPGEREGKAEDEGEVGRAGKGGGAFGLLGAWTSEPVLQGEPTICLFTGECRVK